MARDRQFRKAAEWNITPPMLRAVIEAPDIAESQYDHLLIGTIAGDDKDLLVLRYGSPTP